MEKIFFFDLETTDVDTEKCAIHQMSYVVDLNGEPVETGSIKIAPHEGASIVPKSLEVGNVTLEQINQYQQPVKAYREMLKVFGKYVDKYNKTDKFTLCGFNNNKFDNEVLRNFFKRMGDDYFGSWFFSSTYDCMVMSAFVIGPKRNLMENFQLKTVCVELGMEVDSSKLHDASYDIAITRGLFYKIKNITTPVEVVRSGGGRSVDWVFFGDGRYSVLYNGLQVASVLKCVSCVYVDMRNISGDSFVAVNIDEATDFIHESIANWYS